MRQKEDESLTLQTWQMDPCLGMSPEVGGSLAQAGGVCLDSQRHFPGVVLPVTGLSRANYSLIWAPIDDQARNSWNDDQEATEYGASAIAVLLVHSQLGYTIASRARKRNWFRLLARPRCLCYLL